MIETKFIETEVGLIPEDWEVVSLHDIGDVKMCRRVMKYQTSEKGEIPFYKIGTFGNVADAYISKELYLSLKEKYNYPNKGDILLSAAGTIGRTVVFDGKPSFFQDSNIVWIDNNESRLINSLLYYIYSTLNWVTESGTIPRIYNSIVESIKFPIPVSLSEQRRIASALSSVDELISSLDTLIEKKRNIKQGTMQQLLTGKKRLNGFDGKHTKYKDTEIGKIPEDWNMYSIGDIGTFSKGSGISRAESNTGNIPAIRYGEIYTCHNNYVKEFFSHISISVAQHSKLLNYGDILFTTSGETKEDIAKAAAFISNTTAYAGGDIIILSPQEGFDSKYLGFLLNTSDVIKQRSSKAQGDAVVHITQTSIESIKIALPSLPEQRAIAAVLTNMDDEIAALENKRDKYIATKQGMMQQLLTGKIRLI